MSLRGRRERPRAEQPRERSRVKPGGRWRTGLSLVGYAVGLVVVVVVVAVGSRELARSVAPSLVLWADGDDRRLVAIVLVMWAVLTLLLAGALQVGTRAGRWAAAPVWLLAGGLGLLLIGFVPGKHDDGHLARQLDEVTGNGLAGSGDVLVGAGLAGFLTVLVLVVVLRVLAGLVPSSALPARGRLRTALVALLCVGVWVASWVLTVSAVDASSASRGDWLADTARALRGGDAGVTGGFDVGLDASLVQVVDCDTAAGALRVDGAAPALDGCRQALLVAATGRHDLDGVRSSSGALSAVVVQVRTEDQVTDLTGALDGAALLARSGLPAPSGTTTVGAARAALAVVVTAEDPGELPLPAEGPGRRPLSRALAYVVIGSAVGLYLAPPTGPVQPTGPAGP